LESDGLIQKRYLRRDTFLVAFPAKFADNPNRN
jgi:hypothetical protein